MSISKTLRFEVFKRDKFSCQYCGKSAPDVLLQVDHIQPVSKDGDDDIMNLVTACDECNAGKSNRLLSNDATLQKRKKQLDDLQERRDQIEMMFEWQQSLAILDDDTIAKLAEYWTGLVPGYSLNEHGLKSLRKTMKRWDIQVICGAMRTSAQQYLVIGEDGKPTSESVNKAWDYVARICAAEERIKDKPYLRDLYYARGIMCKRFSYVCEWEAMALMEDAIAKGISTERLLDLAKHARYWSEWQSIIQGWIQKANDQDGEP